MEKKVHDMGLFSLRVSVLSGLPVGLNDNDPLLIEAMEKKLDKLLLRHTAKAAGVTDEHLLYIEHCKDPKEKAELIRELGYEGLTTPEIEAIRIDCIEFYLQLIEKHLNKLDLNRRLLARQFKAFLESKKNPDNDYIIPSGLINELYQYNEKNEYWAKESPEKWQKRFTVKPINTEKLDYINKDKFHLMVDLVAAVAQHHNKIKNRYKDVALTRFGYTKFSDNAIKYPKFGGNIQINDVHFNELFKENTRES